MEKSGGYIEEFIRKLMMSNLYEFINYKTFGALNNTLLKLVTNLPSTSICLYFGLTSVLKDLNNVYKNLQIL